MNKLRQMRDDPPANPEPKPKPADQDEDNGQA